MKNWPKIILPLLIIALMLIYGCGDYLGWWDCIRGRSNALAAYNRLTSTKGGSEIFIKKDQKEFHRLYFFMIKRTQESNLKELHKKGVRPEAIVRVGGTLGHELKNQIPPTWPDVRFVSGTLPVTFMYNFTKEENKVARVCSLDDLRRWIEESRNQERFIFTTILIGLLSLLVAMLELRKKNT